jgi:hypothetical protein
MTTIRKFVFAALLAVTLNLAPNLSSAQEPARGKFTLAHDVHWGNAEVPAGEYRFSFDPGAVSPILTLHKLTGARAGFMLLVPTVDESKAAGMGQIVLETTPAGSYVSSMQLPESGMTLRFAIPAHAGERQLAKAANTASGSGQ